MHVPFVDLKIQYTNIKSEIDAEIHEILDSATFIMGAHVKEFEDAFANIHGVKYCIGTSSGTDSLHLALWALGISHGDKVVVPVNTFIATAAAVSICGAEPVFIDCDEYFNIDIKKIEYKLSDMTVEQRDKIKAIMPVHLYGQPADMKEILDLSDKYNLLIVEDACQAHLAKYQTADSQWLPVGSIGNAGAFSFYPGKNLGAYGEAGAVVTNDPALYEIMLLIHDHGSQDRYHHDVVGHNYRMEAFQGAILSVKLKYIEKWTRERQEKAYIYNVLLSGIDEVITPEIKPGRTHSFHLYVIRCKKRDELKKYLQEQGITTGLHYPIPLHLQTAYAHLNYSKGDFPMAERLAGEILSLPMFPELTEVQIHYVLDHIKNFYTLKRRV